MCKNIEIDMIPITAKNIIRISKPTKCEYTNGNIIFARTNVVVSTHVINVNASDISY